MPDTEQPLSEEELAWGDEPDVGAQVGARFEDLSEADQKLISLSEQREAFDQTGPTELPQPDRAASVPDLPKVKSGVFPKLLK